MDVFNNTSKNIKKSVRKLHAFYNFPKKSPKQISIVLLKQNYLDEILRIHSVN